MIAVRSAGTAPNKPRSVEPDPDDAVMTCPSRHSRKPGAKADSKPCLDHDMEPMKLVWPLREYLPSYVAALERGWSPDNTRGLAATEEELRRIAEDADAFLASLVDREAR